VDPRRAAVRRSSCSVAVRRSSHEGRA
jgi:hypothetical protein